MAMTEARIAPREVEIPTKFPPSTEPDNSIMGILVWLGLWTFPDGIATRLFSPQAGFYVGLVAFFAGIPLAIRITHAMSLGDRQKLRAKYIEELKASRAKEAESTALQVVHLAELGDHSAASLSSVIEQTEKELKMARTEYADHAFAPFWDAVERATQQIAVYRNIVTTINDKADRYYKTLHGREHTFGPFPVGREDLPTLGPLLIDYRDVVRLGQTDFQFATIYEQRKTREVLIQGFRTLGEAIENVGHVVTQSISELETTMQDGLLDLGHRIDTVGESADAAVKELRSQTAKLENIQWKRKPQSPGQ